MSLLVLLAPNSFLVPTCGDLCAPRTGMTLKVGEWDFQEVSQAGV